MPTCVEKELYNLQMERKSPDGPLLSMQNIDGKLFWISSLASLDPSFWSRERVCYQFLALFGHVYMNDQSSKWFWIECSFVGCVCGAQSPTTSVVIPRQRRLRPTAWGRTPLHLAAYKGQVKVAELLLSKGAALDAKDDDGPGPQRQGQKSHLQIGTPRKVFRAWDSEKRCAFSVNVWERCDFPSQNDRNGQFCLGINDQNVTCLKHVNMCGERLIWRFSGHASRHLFHRLKDGK